jgi:hypothetical protein
METRKQLEQRIKEKYETTTLGLIAMALSCFSAGFSTAVVFSLLIR